MADEECFPPGLKRLVQQLASAAVPGIEELPDLTDLAEFGPCFNAEAIRSQGKALTGSGSWDYVRLKVLSSVATCPTLTYVNLSNCCIVDESEMRILGLGLEKSETLEILNLSGNLAAGSKDGCGFINRILNGCKNLHTLNLARVGMGWEGMAKICGAMGHDIALRYLDVSGNPKLGDNGMALLAAVLKGQMNASRTKDSAGAGSRGSFEGLKSLTIGIMGVGGADHLGQALAAQTSRGGALEVLTIVGPTGEEEMVQEEEGSPLMILLTPLVHPGHPTEYDDMSAPAMYNESLQILSLKFVKECGLPSILSDILRSNNTLLELHLEGSEFSRVEWRHVLQALHGNTSLKTLFLGSCRGLGDVFEDFMELVRANSTIEFIELPHTDLERSGQNILIMEALNKGSTANGVHERVVESLQEMNVGGVPSHHETWGENITADTVTSSESVIASGGEESCSFPFPEDLKTLPKELVNLILQLSADSPTITVLPRLSTLNIEEFGDFFTFPHFTRESKDQTWWQTRRAILKLICSCPTLTHIDLEGCAIHKEEEAQDLCLGLAKSQRLEMLNLGGNGAFGTEVGCLHLCRLLVKIPTLRELHLHAIDMKPDFLVYLAAAMRRTENCSLHTLDINFNPSLGDEGAEHLATLLADPENSGGIRHLRMFGTGMDIKGAFLLSIALRMNTTLRSLFVGFETEDENAEGPLRMLLSAFVPQPSDGQSNSTQLEPNSTVENLGVCGGREKGLVTLVSKILEMSRIRALSLNRTYFSKAEWQVIFRSLRDNTSLEALDLTECEGLEAEVHGEMMSMLESNKKLTDITLTGTELERQGSHHSVHAELLQRNGSASGSGTPFLTPSSSNDWSHHGRGSDLPPGTPYEAMSGGSYSQYNEPVTASPYQPGTATFHQGQEIPSWMPASSGSGPPSYFSPGPPGVPSSTPGPPAYFSTAPPPGPPRSQTSSSNSMPPPPPPYPGFSNPVDAHPGVYQTHGGGYMMNPEPVPTHRYQNAHHVSHQTSHQNSHHQSHHSSHQPSHQISHQNSQQHSQHNTSQEFQSSNEWSPSGDPVWSAKPDTGTPLSSDGDSYFDGGDVKSRSKLRNWAHEKKEKVKEKKELVVEVAKAGKDLVKEVAKDRKERVLGKLGRKPSTKA
ncbi:hypothetical protein Mapa_013875 [Marchantia paleacea]|nr:hypothetical protein Mapa_013875 [Marchantia paleacea]